MINEALPAVPIIIVYKHKTILKLFKKNSVELFIVLCEFPFCQTLDGRNCPAMQKSMFSKQKKYENLHLFALITCKYMAKS